MQGHGGIVLTILVFVVAIQGESRVRTRRLTLPLLFDSKDNAYVEYLGTKLYTEGVLKKLIHHKKCLITIQLFQPSHRERMLKHGRRYALEVCSLIKIKDDGDFRQLAEKLGRSLNPLAPALQ